MTHRSLPRLGAGPGSLTCSAFPGPNASPPYTRWWGAGTQTGVVTAPKAASPCSSWSREGLMSPTSSSQLPTPVLAGGLFHRTLPPPPNALAPPPPIRARGPRALRPVTQPGLLQSEGPQVASPLCRWGLLFPDYQGGSTFHPPASPRPWRWL